MRKALIVLLTLSAFFSLSSSSKDSSPWWIYNYGDYANTEGKNDPRVQQAFAVFERLKNAADKSEDRPPRLFIINTQGEPYAQALPDGGIIINTKTLDICYTGVDKEKGNQRTAFILGHELAHLAHKDFLHMEAFLALKEHGDEKVRKDLFEYFKRSDPEKTRECKKKELLADSNGAIYAAMAGYDIGELFEKKDNFLKHWARQSGIGYFYDKDPKHPSFQKREQFIRSQLLKVVKQVELFRAGVLLYHMANYHDGAAAFREFAKDYPAREVFNNIGACYFNLALHHLHLKFSDDYYRFRLSTTIDYDTSAVSMQSRGEGDYIKNKDISRDLKKAVDYFKRAVARDAQDRTSRYNLAAALILKKEYAEAQAVCNKILKRDPQDINALINKAIAFYYYGKQEDLETHQKAIQALEKAHRSSPDNSEILYNLAALKQERTRLAGAKLFWEKYLNLSTTPRDNFYNHIYKKLKGTEPPISTKTAVLPRMPAGIGLGKDFSRLKKKWGSDHSREFKLGIEEDPNSESWYINLQVMEKDNIRVLALDGTIELVEQECNSLEKKEEILETYGPPRKIVHHTTGNFYIYTGFSFKEINGEIHSYIWFEKGF
jgi:tetratricopeptide (TPR) repeat protein